MLVGKDGKAMTGPEIEKAVMAHEWRMKTCTCPLPYRAIKPETHEESCPALTINN